MCEILFRGKRTDNGEWVYGSPIFQDIYVLIRFWNSEEFEYEEYLVIPDTVGQYTGLSDKNGAKVFEGDIIKCRHEWHNWNTSFGNDEKNFLEQKNRGAYGKCINKKGNGLYGQLYYYFRNYAVEYYVLNGGYRVRNGSCFHALTQSYIFNRDLEIIGNIHDNPELLKGGEG